MKQPTSALDYELPEAAIAQVAIEPRDASRLLVTSDCSDHVFADLPALLKDGDLLVVNTTKVRRARIRTTRSDSGGAVEVMLLAPGHGDTWEVMLRPARRLRSGTELRSAPGRSGGVLEIEIVSDPVDGIAMAKVATEGSLEEAVADVGEMPLPPYFHGVLADDNRYQTLFAAQVGSAAAPTAALHFTDQVVANLGRRGVSLARIELQVGLDTFRPIAVDDIGNHQMHTERYLVPDMAAQAIAVTRQRGGRVVAVGTTVTRALESAAAPDGTVAPGAGVSRLFITPGYRPRVVDALLTNFHAPRTTLIALVAALIGERWRGIYATALDRGYRFLSFGDAMLIDDFAPEATRQ